MLRKSTHRYNFDGLAGCVQIKRTRLTGVHVGIYFGADAGMDTDHGLPWSTVCEAHASICAHPTLRIARIMYPCPDQWCESCERIYNDGLMLPDPKKHAEGDQFPLYFSDGTAELYTLIRGRWIRS